MQPYIGFVIKSLCTVTITFGLAACGGGNNSASGAINPDTPVTYVGILALETSYQSGEADFYFVEDGVAVSRLRESGNPFNTEQCRARKINSRTFEELADSGPYTNPYPSSDLGEPELMTLSAGDSIQFYSGGDVYTNWIMRRVIGDEDSIYYNGDLPDPMPAQVTAEISGESFPAVSGLKIPGVLPPTILSPNALEPMTPATIFRWQEPATNAQFRSHIILQARWENDATNERTTIDCVFDDDGESELPAEIKTMLDTNFSTTTVRLYRESVFEYQNGNVYVIVVTTSASGQFN